MAGPFGTLAAIPGEKKAAKRNAEYAKQQQRAGMQLINELDYEPEYASNHVPTYQRSQSPVARAYLESFLSGDNPDTISPTAPNAIARRQAAQTRQNAMYGTPQERLAQQNAYFAQQPWKVTAPTRPINPNRSTDTGAAQWTAENSDFASYGVNKALSDALNDTGTNLEALKGQAMNKHGNPNDALAFGQKETAVATLLKEDYGGDANRMAADVRAAGGLEQLLKQRGRK
jgi:hypothetical protein